MDELIKYLINYVLPGLPIGIVVILILLFIPEKIEKWSAMLWHLLSKFGNLFKTAHKRYVKHDLQGRINEFVKGLSADVPHLASRRIEVEWVSSEITRNSFLKDGKVILRLRRADAEDTNFVHGAYLFVSTSLLFRVKRYISPSQRGAIDLYVTTKLFEREKPSVVDHFLEEHLHSKLQDPESKMAHYFDLFAHIDTRGLFYPVLLEELDFLGSKVFGRRQDDRIIKEVDSLVVFLKDIASRKIGEESDLNFERQYCRFAIMIIGKPSKLAVSIDPYLSFIKNQLTPKKIETIYIVGLWDNRHIIDEICKQLQGGFEKCRTRKSKTVLCYDHREVEKEQYVAVLRLLGTPIYHPSNLSAH